jgi:cytochrome P450
MVGATVELSLSLTNIINVFLSDEEISKKVSHCTAATDLNDLKAYVAEALRLDPPFRGVYRNATKAQEVGPVSVKEGHKVFVNITAANLDEATFKGAKTVDITRTKSLYVAGGDVANRCLGESITTQASTRPLPTASHTIFDVGDP